MANTKKATLSERSRNAIITMANSFLANPENSQDEKQNIFCEVEHILHTHNCYKGFNWIRWVKEGGASLYFSENPNWQETDCAGAGRTKERYMGFEWDRFFY